MDSTYRSIKATLPQLAIFELADLIDAAHEELRNRECGYEEITLDGTEVTEEQWSEYERHMQDEGRE